MSLSIEAILAICLLIILLRFVRRSNEVKRERETFQRNSKQVFNEPFPYRAKYLLTKSEYKFYLVLKEICDKHNCLICPKVGLKELANVTCKDNYYHWFHKISAKHVDFIITDHTLKPFAAIELDDKSHRRAEVKERDQFKNEFFAAIKLPLFRFELDYTKETVESSVFPSEIMDITNTSVS